MATGTQSRGKLLDYEQYIDHQLNRTRSRIRMNDVLTASLLLATVAISVLFLEVVLDHQFALSAWTRRIVLFTGLAAGGAFAAWRIVRPLVSNISGLYAAKTIEGAEPGFKNGLINYLSLRKNRDDVPKAYLAAIEAKAVSQLTKVDVEAVVNQRRVSQTFYALAGIVAVMCVYFAFNPKSISDSVRRTLFLADIAPPTDTRLVIKKPEGDPALKKVVAGSHVPFEVEWSGTRPESIVLHYSIDGGDFFAEQAFAAGKNFYDPWQTTLRNVQRSIDYYLTGGDARTNTFRVEVIPAPMVTAVAIDLDFPDYTGVPDRQGVEGGGVDAIEGTYVTVHAETSEPAISGTLNLNKLGAFAMNPSPDDSKKLVGKFKVTADGTYTIGFRTPTGQVNPEPVVYDVRARKDAPPSAKFTKPGASVKVPSNGKVPLAMEATDDFGVKEALLHVNEGTRILVSDNLLQKKPPVKKLIEAYTLDLAKLKVAPGAKLEYWLTVRDTKDPLPNKFETAKYEIEVVEPVAKDEVAALDKKAKDAQDEADRDRREEQQAGTADQVAENGAPGGEPKPGEGGKGQGRPAENGKGQPGDPTNQLANNDPPTPNPDAASEANPDGANPEGQPDIQQAKRAVEAAKRLGLRPPQKDQPGGKSAEENGLARNDAGNPPDSKPERSDADNPGQTNPSNPVSRPQQKGGRDGKKPEPTKSEPNQGKQDPAEQVSRPESNPEQGSEPPSKPEDRQGGQDQKKNQGGQSGAGGQKGQPQQGKQEAGGDRSQSSEGAGSPGGKPDPSKPGNTSKPNPDDAKAQAGRKPEPGQTPGQKGDGSPPGEGSPSSPNGNAPDQPGGKTGAPNKPDPKTSGTSGRNPAGGNTPPSATGETLPTKRPEANGADAAKPSQGGEKGTTPPGSSDPKQPQPGDRNPSGTNPPAGRPEGDPAPKPGQGDKSGSPRQEQGAEATPGKPPERPETKSTADPKAGSPGPGAGNPPGSPDAAKGNNPAGAGQGSQPGKPGADPNVKPGDPTNPTPSQGEPATGKTGTESGAKPTDGKPGEAGDPKSKGNEGDPRPGQADPKAAAPPGGPDSKAGTPKPGDPTRTDGKPGRPGEAPKPGDDPGTTKDASKSGRPGEPGGNPKAGEPGPPNGDPKANKPGDQAGKPAGDPKAGPGDKPQTGATDAPESGTKPGESPQGGAPTDKPGETPKGQSPDPGKLPGGKPTPASSDPKQGEAAPTGDKPGEGTPSEPKPGQPGADPSQAPGGGEAPPQPAPKSEGPGKGSDGKGTKPSESEPSNSKGNAPGQTEPNGPGEASPDGTPKSEGAAGKGGKPGQAGKPGEGNSQKPGASGKGDSGEKSEGDTPGQAGKPSQPGEGAPSNSGQKAPGGAQPGESDSPKRGGEGSKPGQAGQPGQAGKPGSSGTPGAGNPAGGPPSGRGQPGAGTPTDQQGGERGDGAGTNAAGGGKDTPRPVGATPNDKSTPSPAAPEAPANPAAPIAPDSGVDQGPSLVTRQISDLLKENRVTPDVEKELGMTRAEMEQFVKKYEKGKPRPAAGPGREIKVDPNAKGRTVGPDYKAAETLPDLAVSKSTSRSGNVAPTDTLSGLSEGAESAAPKAYQSKFNAYKSSLGRASLSNAPRRPATPSPTGGPTNP